MKKLLFFIATLVCMCWGQAYADYSFTFNNTALGVTGTLITSSIGGGSYTVTGGSLTGTGTQNDGVVYNLTPPNSSAPNTTTTVFDTITVKYNDTLLANSNPILDQYGLVFEASIPNSILIRLYDNGNSYELQQIKNATFAGTTLSSGTATISPETGTPTPIPAATWLLGSGLMGLFGLRRKEKV